MIIPKISYSFFNFSAKQRLYTDFDKTYFPFAREDIKPSSSQAFRNMYLPFIHLKQDKGDEFELVITTGRSKNDYLHTQGLIEESGLDYCYPDGLVSANGANVFRFENGVPTCIFPQEDSNAQDAIDGIVHLIQDYDKDISIIECKINGSEKMYQDYSSEAELDKTKPEKYITIARDGKYNVEMVVSKRNDFEQISALIRDYVEENNLPFALEFYETAKYTEGIEYSDNGKQVVKAGLIFLKYAPSGIQPDKFDIIKEEVRKIQDSHSDDLIIVAGDGYNDEMMLNPLNYLEGSKDIDNPKCIEELSQLPLRSIICADDPKLESLRELSKKLKEKGLDIIKLAPDSRTDFIKAIKEFDDINTTTSDS